MLLLLVLVLRGNGCSRFGPFGSRRRKQIGRGRRERRRGSRGGGGGGATKTRRACAFLRVGTTGARDCDFTTDTMCLLLRLCRLHLHLRLRLLRLLLVGEGG